MTDTSKTALSLRGITKSFGSNLALKGIDIDIMPGEFVGLLGPNGAGKSTLVKILDGVHQPSSGEVYLNGQRVLSLAGRPEVGFVHQDLGLVDDLSILENLRLGQPPLRSVGPVLSSRKETRAAHAALEAVELTMSPSVLVREISPAEKALVAMARVFSRGARVIFVDEVTSTLPPGDALRVMSTLSRSAEAGATIIMVTHKLSEVLGSTKRIIVIVDGLVAVDRATDGLDHAQLTSLFVKHDRRNLESGGHGQESLASSNRERILLSMREVHYGVLGPINLDVHGGEVIGIGGLPGSGLHDLGFLAHGVVKPEKGEVIRDQSSKTALVPPHRESQGGFDDLSVEDNLASSSLFRWRDRLGFLHLGRQHRAADDMVKQLAVAPADRNYRYGSLSGGNKQKVVFGRALLSQSNVFVLCEPTRGVDVAARREIYSLIRQMRDNGDAVLILSSDSEDILSVCDRISVIIDGQLTEPRSVAEFTLKEFEALL